MLGRLGLLHTGNDYRIEFINMFTCKNCGLTLELDAAEFPFTCVCSMQYAAPKRPGILKKAANFATAAAAHVRAGRPKTPPAEYEKRLAECDVCPYNQGGQCTMCGCSVSGTGILNKLAWADQACPIGRWDVCATSGPRLIETKQLITDTYKLAAQLPPDITQVVGVSRSGLLPASLLAMHLHARLAAFDGERVVELGNGWRLTGSSPARGRTLVVDDSVATGRSFDQVKGLGDLFASVYLNPKSNRRPDYYAEALELPHYFQWNLFNAHYRAAYDFDGVLCEDVRAEDFNKPEHDAYLFARPPLYLPRRQNIDLIVTARLEKYRDVTLAWLDEHRIKCDRLVMWQGSSADRNKLKAISNYKAAEYSASDLQLFIESDPVQAREIAEISGRRVICTGTNEVY